jgi:hypothetical protein
MGPRGYLQNDAIIARPSIANEPRQTLSAGYCERLASMPFRRCGPSCLREKRAQRTVRLDRGARIISPIGRHCLAVHYRAPANNALARRSMSFDVALFFGRFATCSGPPSHCRPSVSGAPTSKKLKEDSSPICFSIFALSASTSSGTISFGIPRIIPCGANRPRIVQWKLTASQRNSITVKNITADFCYR